MNRPKRKASQRAVYYPDAETTTQPAKTRGAKKKRPEEETVSVAATNSESNQENESESPVIAEAAQIPVAARKRGRKESSSSTSVVLIDNVETETEVMHENKNILNENESTTEVVITEVEPPKKKGNRRKKPVEEVEPEPEILINVQLSCEQKQSSRIMSAKESDLYLSYYGKIDLKKLENLFQIGTYRLVLKKLAADNVYECIYDMLDAVEMSDLKQASILVQHRMTYTARRYVMGPRDYNKRHSFFLHVKTHIANYLFEINDNCDQLQLIALLLNSKLIHAEIERFDLNSLELDVNVLLSDRLDKTGEIEEDPSATFYPGRVGTPDDLICLLEQFKLIRFDEYCQPVEVSGEENVKEETKPSTSTVAVTSATTRPRLEDGDDDYDFDLEYWTPYKRMNEINQELIRRNNNHRRISYGRGEADDNAASAMDYDDDEATSEQRENIFDLIYKIRGEIKQAEISGEDVQRLSGLKASLRPYQIDAVKWMMHKEAIGLDAKLHSHPHYIAVRNSFGQCIYLHTFFAVYSTRMPMKLSSIPGGILADEMGLGKTLEILALIGINRRNKEQSTTSELDDTNIPFTPRMQSQVSEVAVSQPEKTTKTGSEKASFSCLCGKTPNQFLAGYTKKEDFDDDEEFNYEDKDDGEVNFDDDDDEEYESDDDEAGNRKRQKRRKKNNHKSRKRQRNRAEKQTSSSSLFLSSERNSNRFGERSKQNDQEKVYQCTKCSVYSHPRCLNYIGTRQTFLCLQCCTRNPLESACTLIVTPASICMQWFDEIDKHLRSSHLKVKIYRGINVDEFKPFDLASLDVCITTYEVLASELDHVFAFENMRELRKPKRYMNIPSPLVCINWWRVCLDEAQMVHSTQAKCAAMANRLAAVNRWCVTGTPIGRSLGDLQGLFVFIREDPYQHQRWFNNILALFRKGNKETLTRAVANVLWRTAKKHVEDQIHIPKQTERAIWLSFSPFESHLYERVIEQFRGKRKRGALVEERHQRTREEQDAMLENLPELTDHIGIEDYFNRFGYTDNERLDELDRNTIDRMLDPIVDLRLSCNHPQLVLRKRTFNANFGGGAHQNRAGNAGDRLLTMEASLKLLMNKTQTECDNHFRAIVMHLNGMAGLSLLMENEKRAIEIYETVLNTAERDYSGNVKLDLLQKVHTLHNLVDVLRHISNDEDVAKIEQLEKELRNCEREYLVLFEEKASKSVMKFIEKEDLMKRKIKEKKEPFLRMILTVLKNIDEWSSTKPHDDFWNVKLNGEFTLSRTAAMQAATSLNSSQEQPVYEYVIFGKSIRTYTQLELILVAEYEQMLEAREHLVRLLDDLKRERAREERDAMVQRVAACHLRDFGIPAANNGANNNNAAAVKTKLNGSCELCECDRAFDAYARCLANKSQDLSASINTDNEDDENEDNEKKNEEDIDELIREQQQHEHRTLSTKRNDMEKLIKLLIAQSRQISRETNDDNDDEDEDELDEEEKEKRELARKNAAQMRRTMLTLSEELKELNEFYTSVREEFTVARSYWLDLSHLVNALDELEMCKIRMQIAPENNSDDSSKTAAKKANQQQQEGHLVHRGAVPMNYALHEGRSKSEKAELGRKLGQLLFLKNSLKTYQIAEGKENEEICPICQNKFGYEWLIMRCGHMFCQECYILMRRNQEADRYPFQQPADNPRASSVRCALCRDMCPPDQCYLVSTRRRHNKPEVKKESATASSTLDPSYHYEHDFDLTGVRMEGQCNSAKVEGIVKCLIKIIDAEPHAKCLVFSEHVTMLEMIVDLLRANSIEHRLAKDNHSLARYIDDFRKSRDINVLLMPYSYGANGLNIIEAHHVLLVEPTLNRSQEFQAIGRVHRIGQTKPTFIYRFMIKNTIEQLLYDILKSHTSYMSHRTTAVSSDVSDVPMTSSTAAKQEEQLQQKQQPKSQVIRLKDLKNLFLNL